MFEFDLSLNRALTDDQELIVLEHMDDAIQATPESGPDGSGSLACAVEGAPSLPVAVVRAAVRLHKLVPTRWATGLILDDTVSLSEAARRTAGARTKQSLRMLANGERGPGGFPAPVVDAERYRLYSWAAIAEFLRDLGDTVPQTDLEALVMDRILAARATVHAAKLDDTFWTETTGDVVAA